jgi:DNA-binding transcriptional LysR family regulator
VRQVYLTEAGQLLFQSVQKVFSDLRATLSQLNPVPEYDVTIAATTYVAARWLSPRVAKFLEHNPETTIRFDHNVNNLDFSLDNVDLAMIWSRCNDDQEIDTLMQIPMPLFPVCNAELANELLHQPDRLKQMTLLYENRSQDLWLEWFGTGVLDNPVQVIEDANVRVQAAIDGQGLILADAMMQSELEAAVLVAPFDKQITGYGYCLKSTAQSRSKKTTASMINWLTKDYEQIQ